MATFREIVRELLSPRSLRESSLIVSRREAELRGAQLLSDHLSQEQRIAEETESGVIATVTRGAEVRVKYRDPATGETWTGRGRMATWLKQKLDAGEDIEKYRV